MLTLTSNPNAHWVDLVFAVSSIKQVRKVSTEIEFVASHLLLRCDHFIKMGYLKS